MGEHIHWNDEKQKWEVDSAYKKRNPMEEYAFDNAQYIFKGKVISKKCFQVEKKGVYTSFKVQINEIFRGNESIESGTIEIIMIGGYDGCYLPNGILVLAEDWEPLPNNGVYFCVTADYPSKIQTDNSIRVRAIDYVEYYKGTAFYTEYKGTTSEKRMYFKNNKELYEFLSKHENITIPDENAEK